jgi:hypothetical protein
MLAEGKPPPDWSIEPPSRPWEGLFLSAYWNLDTERFYNGWTIPPIPESKIYAYGCRLRLRGDVLDAFIVIVRQLDNAHRRWMRDEIEAERAANDAKNKR